MVISTPDHQHAILAVDAVRAGKDVYLQKPASLTIAEGRAMSNAVTASGQILQIGSQQRSWKQFHRACELVRNGRIGAHQACGNRLAGRPQRAGCAAYADSSQPRLRRMAGLHARGLLHRDARASAAGLSTVPAGCAASSSGPA